eukprot:GILI01005169.1.p1 GENE.GILI01005169.1~~GILI01005169.1.p1  ORF type:complete len:923 (-),score=197.45 GILI01005169.1:856-3222(-)
MQALEIQAGGIITQNYPLRPTELGLDVYNLDTDHDGYVEVINIGTVKTVGPGPLWSGGTGIYFRYPIYVSPDKGLANFWGTGNVVLQAEGFLQNMTIDTMVEDDQMHYIMWYFNSTDDVTVLSSDPSNEEVMKRDGLRMELAVAETGRAAYLAMYPIGGFKSDNISGSTAAIIIIISIFGSVILGILLSIALFSFLVGRSHANAPKNQLERFTLMFTDIQSSTSLWAEAPEDMANAIAEHHRIIRVLIKKHRGYEVKTIGDAFMIAFKLADDAVLMSAELQHDFFNSQNFSRSIDECYKAFDKEKLMQEDIDESMLTPDHPFYNLSCRLSPQRYCVRWRGLRVRCGINTAFGEIQRDEVADSYDYYGTVANTAARVESVAHGGQVVLTESTLQSLQDLTLQRLDFGNSRNDSMVLAATLAAAAVSEEVTSRAQGESIQPVEKDAIEIEVRPSPTHRDSVVSQMSIAQSLKNIYFSKNEPPRYIKALGSVELRGLADPVKLFELQCVRGRAYPPLRLERQMEDDDLNFDNTTDNTNSTAQVPSSANLESSSRHDGSSTLASQPMNFNKVQFASILATIVSSLPTDQRAKTLKRMCESWRLNPASPDAIRLSKDTTIVAIQALVQGDAALTSVIFALASRLHKVAKVRLSRVAEIKGGLGHGDAETASVLSYARSLGGSQRFPAKQSTPSIQNQQGQLASKPIDTERSNSSMAREQSQGYQQRRQSTSNSNNKGLTVSKSGDAGFGRRQPGSKSPVDGAQPASNLPHIVPSTVLDDLLFTSAVGTPRSFI